jgi:hypothetical protein
MYDMYERQNKEKALNYLKAGVLCKRRERFSRNTVLVFSLAICILGIVNNSFNFMEAEYLILISGVLLIVQSFLGWLARKYRMEHVTMMEMFDSFVYGMTPNVLMMRTISEVEVEAYARKVRDKKGLKYRNWYYKTRNDADKRNAVLDNQYQYFVSRYKLMLSARVFFYTIWVSFFVMLIAFSFSSNELFSDTLVNIFVPSLNMILLIVSSWQVFNTQLMVMQDNVGTFGKLRQEGSTSTHVFTRTAQDAIFKIRMQSFAIPKFLKFMLIRQERKHKMRYDRAGELAMAKMDRKTLRRKRKKRVTTPKAPKTPKPVKTTKPKSTKTAKPKPTTPSKPTTTTTVKKTW